MSDQPIPAATLVVVREVACGPPELLMVERAAGMAFAGGALVFPGGRIDEADMRLGEDLGLPDGAARIAAIRETIEETAVPVGLTPVPSHELALQAQAALIAERRLSDVLSDLGLSVDAATLVPLARWVPKFHASRRFDTMFFLAQAPRGDWSPHPIESECTHAFWQSAAEVLERDRDGAAQLIFPTRRNLERLAQHSSFGEMRADAEAHLIAPITPWVEERGGEKFVTIEEGIGYPVTQERLAGLWRG